MTVTLNTERDQDGFTLTDPGDAAKLYRIEWDPTAAVYVLRCTDPNWLAAKRRRLHVSKLATNVLSRHVSMEGAEFTALAHRADRLAALRYGLSAA